MNYNQMMWEHHHYRFGLAGEGQADLIQGYLDRCPGRVLNVGCGLDGLRIQNLARHATSLLAADISLEALRMARPAVSDPKVAFVRADAQTLPLTGGSVRSVVAMGLLTYLPEPSRAVNEFARVCRVGGHVMLTASVTVSRDPCMNAARQAGLRLLEDVVGYCPAASGSDERRYLLVFARS